LIDAVFVGLTARWLAGWYLGGRLPTLEPASATSSTAPSARVSLVIPARNEAAVVPALLRSLRQQTVSPLEVIVVDDHSTDHTAAAAALGEATVITAAALPDGWLGKPWACAQGAAAASGDILVFLDADTVAGPELLQRLAAAVERSRGLVSVAPYHDTRRAYELASALFNLVAMMGVGASSLRREARVTGAFGPCIAMRADDYRSIGGHGAVRNEVLEDVALARVCRQRQLPVTNVAGTSHLRYRMYPDGIAQLIEGWSKNFAAGAATTPPLRLAAIVAWLSGLIEAGVMALTLSRTHLVFYALFAFQLWFLLRRIGNHSAIAWFHPLASLMFLLISARSAFLQLRGEVTWKGRRIRTSPRPRS
jgi:4,4'-diaponeurosporenoate glycosyltransferase